MAITGTLGFAPSTITDLFAYGTTATVGFQGLSAPPTGLLSVRLSGGNFSESKEARYANGSILPILFSIKADEVGFPADSNSVTFTAELYDIVSPSNRQLLATASAILNLNAPPTVENITFQQNVSGLNNYIEGITPIEVQATVKALFGATVSTVSAIVDYHEGTPTQISLTNTSGDEYVGTIPKQNVRGGNPIVYVDAVDSRGKTATADATIAIQTHTNPSLTYDIFRCDEYGDRNKGGRYISVTAYANSNPIELGLSELAVFGKEKNTSNVIIDNGSGQRLPINNGQTYVFGGTLDPATAYTITLYAADSASTYGGTNQGAMQTITIPVVVRIFNVKDGGTGLAVGKLSTVASRFDSAWDINTDGGYYVNGTPLIDTLPNASSSVRGLVSTGAQTFAGQKTLSAPRLQSSKWPSISAVTLDDVTTGEIFLLHDQDGSGTLHDIHWGLRQYSPNSTPNTTTTGKYETYYLPAATSGLASNASYSILTTKPVDVSMASDVLNNYGAFHIRGYGNELKSGDNVDTDLETGKTYYSKNSSTTASLAGTVPMSGSGFKIAQIRSYHSDNYLFQLALGASEIPRIRYKGTGSWGAWREVYTSAKTIPVTNGGTGATTADAALAALGGAKLVNLGAVSGTSSVVINIPNSSRHVLFLTAIVSGYHAAYICTTSAAGAMYGQQIAQGSGYTRSTTTNTVTFAKGASANVTVFDLVLTGSAASLVTT